MRITGARKKIRIGDLLVEAGAITPEQLQEALAKQKEEGGMLGNIIMELGFISRELLITVLTTQMGIVSLPFGYGVSSFSAVEQQVVLPDPTPVKGHFEAEVEMEFEIELPAVEEFRKLPDEFYNAKQIFIFSYLVYTPPCFLSIVH